MQLFLWIGIWITGTRVRSRDSGHIIGLRYGLGECGECCRIHNLITSDIDEKWCSNYCCKSVGTTYCCDSSFLQAPEEDRLPFCTDWLQVYVWVPIVVSIGIVVLCIGCCICCCRACCGRGRETIIVQGGQQGAGTTVVAQQQTTMMNPVGYAPVGYPPSPYSAGYDQPWIVANEQQI